MKYEEFLKIIKVKAQERLGRTLRQEYEYGKILSEQDFEEVLKHVLSSSQEI